MTYENASRIFRILLEDFTQRYPKEFEEFQNDSFAAFGTKPNDFGIAFTEKAPKWLIEKFEFELKSLLALQK